MSLVEPLICKEEDKNQKLEIYSNDPLANLEKSIERLSVEYQSFELDGSSDIENHWHDSSYEEYKFYGKAWNGRDIKCTTDYGNKLVIGRADGIIKIFNLETKEEIVLKGHSDGVNCLQVAPNQDFLVSGSKDKTIIVWNLESYKQERVFKDDYEVFCLELTSGYNLYSGVLNDSQIRKWNFYDENEISTLNGHKEGITCMKSSHNNDVLVTGSIDETLRIWSIEDSKELKVFKNHRGSVDQIVITRNDRYIVSAGKRNDIIIWDLYNKEMIKQIDNHYENTLFLEVTNYNQCIWLKFQQNIVQTYDIENQKPLGIRDNITAITCSKESNLIYYGRDNNTVVILDSISLSPITVLKDFNCKIYQMRLIADKYLASILENGKIKIHKMDKEVVENDFSVQFRAKKNGIKMTRDGKYLIIYYGQLKIWDLIENKEVFLYDRYGFLDIQISYDDKYFAISDKDNFIYLHSFQGMEQLARFGFDNEFTPSQFLFSKDSRFIYVGDKIYGKITVFDVENKSTVCVLNGGKGEISLLQANKTNEYIISSDNGQDLVFWSLLEKKIIKSICMTIKIDYLKLSEKYNCVIIAMRSTIEIWDIREKRKIIAINDIPQSISNLEISEDEQYFIFSQSDEARVWNLELMKEVDTIKLEDSDRISCLDITKDNKFIAIGCSKTLIKLWSCDEKRFIAKHRYLDFCDQCFAKFSPDGKSIIVYNERETRFHNIEDYIGFHRLDSYPYFFNPEYEGNIFRMQFIDWIKNPSKEKWDQKFLGIVVYPIGWNVLHSLCITDSVDLLSIALKDGGEIFRDRQNMSPLSYALARSSRRCIDEILNYVTNIEDDRKLLYCVHQLRDDIPLLFNTKFLSLAPFLEILFRRRPDRDHVGFYEVTEELPMSIFSPVSRIYTSAFTGENNISKKDSAKPKENLIQFWGSPLGYNYSAGSDESLLLLKKMDECEIQEIFQTLFVQSVIREKWDYLWLAIITISIIYWLNLAMMTWYLFDPSIYILISFAVLNGVLALYEFLQVITKPKDYISEIWNLVDWIRMALSITWAFFEFYDLNVKELSFAVVLFNFFRGLTYFRAFDFTRFYVRLILMALSDSLAFLVIFLYSTLAFGVLYASLDDSLSFRNMWTMAYELNMGNFDNGGFSFLQYSCFTLATLINVVMMLNLLVSTLGDTFDKFQMITDELDTKEMLQLVLEFESIMFWARSEQAKLINKGKLMYLQRCDIFQDNDVPDKWQGKIKEISLKIDGVKDDVFGIKKNVGEELKKLEGSMGGNFEKIIDEKIMKSQEKIERTVNEKIDNLELKVENLEPKINGIMEMLEKIKEKLEVS